MLTLQVLPSPMDDPARNTIECPSSMAEAAHNEAYLAKMGADLNGEDDTCTTEHAIVAEQSAVEVAPILDIKDTPRLEHSAEQLQEDGVNSAIGYTMDDTHHPVTESNNEVTSEHSVAMGAEASTAQDMQDSANM